MTSLILLGRPTSPVIRASGKPMRSLHGPTSDTFLTAQAKKGLDVKAYYTAVATAFPVFAGKFGKSAEGILGAGGISRDHCNEKLSGHAQENNG